MKRWLPFSVILIGILLRWYCINWSLPNLFHPDEVRLLYAVGETSWENLNPKFFAYGSLPIYVLKILHVSGKALANNVPINDVLAKLFERPTRIDDFFLVARALSAFFGSLTLILIYFFGKRFFSRRVALFSTAFLAFTVLHIQLSHFLTVDVMLTFFILLAVYFSASVVKSFGSFRSYLLTGLAIGLALATKVSALPLYSVLSGAHILVLLRLKRLLPRFKLTTQSLRNLRIEGIPDKILEGLMPLEEKGFIKEPDFVEAVENQIGIEPTVRYKTLILKRAWVPFSKSRLSLMLWIFFIVTILFSAAVFVVCEPYALLDFKEFYRQVKEQSDMVSGLWQPPYTIQYEKTIPYFYQLKQLFLYSMGLPLGLLTLIGSLFITLITIFKVKEGKAFFTDSYQVILLILLWVIPVFGVIGGFKVKFLRYMLPLIPFFCLLGAVFSERLIQRLPSWKPLIYSVVAITIGFSAFYAVAFVSIYHRDDPRKQASTWIYENVEPDSVLLTESWEFTSLVPVAGHHSGQYRIQRLDLYAPDSEEKIQKLTRQLSEGDIIFLATKRLYGSILRVPERFPLTVHYYKQLFDGNLGFTPVKVFTSYPSLLGITFNDDFADESFSVYEHPKVILFKKTEELSGDEIYELFVTAPTVDDPAAFLRRILSFPALEPDYSSVKRKEIPPNPPLEKGGTFTPDPPQADSGLTGKNTPLATLKGRMEAQAIATWLLAVELLALIAFPLTTLTFRKLPDVGYAVSKVVGILLPAYVVWILVSLKLFTYTRTLIFVVVSVLFLVSFLILLKYLTSFIKIIRTKWKTFLIFEGVFLLVFASFLLFRAYNPDIFWSESSMDFSFLNVLTRTNTFPPPDPWISGFTLNYYYFGHYLVATLTKFTGILPQITYNLAFALFPALVIIEVFSLLYNLTKRYLWGIVGVLLSVIIGNLDGFFLLVATWREKSRFIGTLIGKYSFIDTLIGKEHYYRFFRCAHEVIPYTIHEFPFWTFIFVDLHAHLLNMPFLVAVFLVGFNMLSEDYSPPSRGTRGVSTSLLQVPLSFFLYTLLVGTLAVISSWDYPTAVIFLLLLALVKTYRNVNDVKNFFLRIRPLLYVICVIIPGSILLYLPFYTYFHRRGIKLGRVGSSTTQLSDFLTVFGLFFFVILSFLVFQAWRIRKDGKPLRMFTFLLLLMLGIYTLVLYVFHINYATFLFIAVILLFSSYIFVKQKEWQAEFVSENIFIWICLVYACMIVAGCEIVFVRDFLQGGEYKRMNTIFKFYIPAWFLLSFVTTYALYKLRVQRSQKEEQISHNTFSRYAIWIWIFCFGILFIFSAVFPVMSVYVRRHRDVYNRTGLPLTINGLAYLKTDDPDEYRAIRWLNEHVVETPVILEATGLDYLYEYARISANTGLPTVLGWPSHIDQREHWEYTHQRSLDVTEIYSSGDIENVRRLLRKYRVEYIYVGKIEWKDFTEEQLKKFQSYPEYFEEVFQSGGTIIYRVKYSD